MKSRDSEDISLKREVSLESLFCLLSNQVDHRKNSGGGYRNAFCLIEAIDLLENGCSGEASGQECWISFTYNMLDLYPVQSDVYSTHQ